MIKECALCQREGYETSTEKYSVFDAYCRACRGLFNYLTKVKKWSAVKAKQVISNTYDNDDRRTPGTYNFDGFTRTVIRVKSVR